MSDRKNRDLGRKRDYQMHNDRWKCSCWLCLKGSIKRKVILNRIHKQKKDIENE